MGAKTLKVEKGTRYNKLVLTGESCRDKRGVLLAECMCDCGNICFKRLGYLISGKTKSCGCNKVKHGMSGINTKHPLYGTWMNIKNRCLPNYDQAEYYFDKGVSVCKEWVNDFKAFHDWAISSGWKKGLTIDRYPDQNGNYEPDNCRWSTDAEQNRNKKNNVLITAFGETRCLQDWAQDNRCVVAFNTIRYRINILKWDAEKAITFDGKDRTMRKDTIFVEYKGVKKRLFDWCEELGLRYRHIRARLVKYKWTVEEAFETPRLENKINKINRK